MVMCPEHGAIGTHRAQAWLRMHGNLKMVYGVNVTDRSLYLACVERIHSASRCCLLTSLRDYYGRSNRENAN